DRQDRVPIAQQDLPRFGIDSAGHHRETGRGGGTAGEEAPRDGVLENHRFLSVSWRSGTASQPRQSVRNAKTSRKFGGASSSSAMHGHGPIAWITETNGAFPAVPARSASGPAAPRRHTDCPATRDLRDPSAPGRRARGVDEDEALYPLP